MGKAQSKRSVDITTDPKKDGIIEEGTGEMKKLEDVDQLKPQTNGDTHHNENEKEKPVETTGETENEKDSSTEKEQAKPHSGGAGEGAGGDDAVIATEAIVANAEAGPSPTTENGGDETLDDSKVTAVTDTSAAAGTSETPESNKKSKNKPKKKWSFRNLSFGKKDKQKPSKKDEANTSAVNGECEKVPEETTEEPTTAEKKDDIINGIVTEVLAVEGAVIAAAESLKEDIIAAVSGDAAKPLESEIPVAEVTPVTTNGTTEPPATTPTTKIDEIIDGMASVTIAAAAKIEEKIDEIVAAVINVDNNKTVEEEAAPVIAAVAAAAPTVAVTVTTNGTTKHDDEHSIDKTTTNDDDAAAEAAPPKLNGSSESPKIEVKEDIIATNPKQLINTATENIQNETANLITNIISNEESIIQIIDGGNCIDENAQNILPLISQPPPPLPCSPPPSQVMVFALSDIKNPDETSTTNTTATTTTTTNSAKTVTVSNNYSTHKDEIDDLPEPPPSPHEVKETNTEIISDDDLPDAPPTPPNGQIEQIEQIIRYDDDFKNDVLTAPPQPSQYLQNILNNDNDELPVPIAEHLNDVIETKNIETDIGAGVEQQLSDIDNTKIDLIDSSEESSSLIPSSVTLQAQLAQSPTLDSMDADSLLSNSPIVDGVQQHTEDEAIALLIPPLIGKVDDAAAAIAELSKKIDHILSEETAQDSNGIEEQQTKPQQQEQQTQQNQQNQQKSKKKENGIGGENHADIDEKAVTESLNGVEHKTIEEMKAENQQHIEKVSVEVTQEAAAIVAE